MYGSVGSVGLIEVVRRGFGPIGSMLRVYRASRVFTTVINTRPHVRTLYGMTTSDWQTFFRQTLAEVEAAKLLRRRVWHVEDGEPLLQHRGGRRLINFGTNDYLGLRRDWRLARAVAVSLPSLGVGAGASPLVSGYSSALAELEQQLAAWQQTESALVFSSGLAMNIGLLPTLVGADDLILSDRLNHASLIDGCRLSGAHKRIYAHADVSEVAELLAKERTKYARALVVTESVFSMDGDIAPLEELADVCDRYDAGLIVDEAHASGVLGATGGGLSEELRAGKRWLAKLGTLSKGIGTCGGFVAGSQALVDFLVQRCRSYIYSTAIAPPVVAATRAAVALMPSLSPQRERLRTLGQHVRSSLQSGGWQVPDGRTPIIPVIVGTSERALELSAHLAESGCYVPAIRPPTVPPGGARLRVSLSAAHSDQQIEQLLAAFAKRA